MDQTTQSFMIHDVISPLLSPHSLDTSPSRNTPTNSTKQALTESTKNYQQYYFLPLQINPPILRSIHSSHRIAAIIAVSLRGKKEHTHTLHNSVQLISVKALLRTYLLASKQPAPALFYYYSHSSFTHTSPWIHFQPASQSVSQPLQRNYQITYLLLNNIVTISPTIVTYLRTDMATLHNLPHPSLHPSYPELSSCNTNNNPQERKQVK